MNAREVMQKVFVDTGLVEVEVGQDGVERFSPTRDAQERLRQDEEPGDRAVPVGGGDDSDDDDDDVNEPDDDEFGDDEPDDELEEDEDRDLVEA